ncbi:MAG TPA: UDP-4-amino-4,6-dideoxy-N-acetyl-beta-L-altrosamine transaminase [Elusimicrobia bacterium]|nr:UDP-4-amino-4,6-dideoxy-N-acetyl-beta-L-altrosamine transaminase [Elusimicrobiota bacterium]
MEIPFHKAHITEDEINGVVAAVKSGWLTMGPKTIEFEKKFNDYVFAGSKVSSENRFAISFNSATATLHLALKAIGVKSGDEVIIPTNTFVATAEVVTYFGAIPVLCDVEYDTHNIDASKINACITPKTKAIIPVDYGGQLCDMDEIVAVARGHGIKIIEDAAHCLPSSYKGRRVGTIADITCFSFYATKTLACGEGGMAVTTNFDYAKTMKINRLHGISRDAWDRYTAKGNWFYEVVDNGNKYNTTDIHSALGLAQLAKLEKMYDMRKKVADIYNAAFAGSAVIMPVIRSDRETSWHLYAIKVNNRDELMAKLKESGISTSLHFIPVHRQPYYAAKYGYKKEDYPVSERVYSQSVSLPIYPDMTEEQIRYVAAKVLEYAK